VFVHPTGFLVIRIDPIVHDLSFGIQVLFTGKNIFMNPVHELMFGDSINNSTIKKWMILFECVLNSGVAL